MTVPAPFRVMRPRPAALFEKAVALSLGNLIDKERVHAGNVIQDLSVADRATTVCVARRPIARASVLPLSARTDWSANS